MQVFAHTVVVSRAGSHASVLKRTSKKPSTSVNDEEEQPVGKEEVDTMSRTPEIWYPKPDA